MRSYDFVMAGGGLAGLSLACHLTRSALGAGSLLIVDRQPAALENRTWSYWTDQPTIFDPVVYHRWSQVAVTSPAITKLILLPGDRYEMIRGRELSRFARQQLSTHGNVTFWRGTIDQILDNHDGARVVIDGQPIEAKWVFDSTPAPARTRRGRQQQPGLAMQFKGWTIETPAAAFDLPTATFLDFRTPQQGAARFFYVLPVSERGAFVQYVIISEARLNRRGAEMALQDYLATALSIREYRVVAQEAGALALNASIPPRRLGAQVMAVGAKAGLVKPSTGFGFHRIQLDSAAIVRSLLCSGAPWNVPVISERHRCYDSLLLDVLTQRGSQAQAIFEALFERNPIERALHFLDETSTPAEDLELIATLPARPFLAAMTRKMLALADP